MKTAKSSYSARSAEKPFTTNAADAIILYRIAEEKKLFIMKAFWIRFLPLYETLLEIINSGEYGKLEYAVFV